MNAVSLNGGCQCGAVRYRIEGPVLERFVCHCLECRRQSSSAFGISAMIAPDALTVTQGQPSWWTRPTARGSELRCAFCPECGSRLWHADRDGISVKGGSIDGGLDIEGATHIWTTRKLPGVEIPANAPRFAEEPVGGPLSVALDEPMSPAVKAFWEGYLAIAPADAAARFIEVFSFTDNKEGADELAALVLGGAKRATASLLWGYETDHKPMPYPGSLSIVTDWSGVPCCVIETRSVDIVAFGDVDQVFAETEGEGDKSLRYWREAHWAFFTRECERLRKQPNSRMPVVCERFEVIYPRIRPA
ncbi:hypothetical protein BH10PSE17_BH10PSE17_32510 [soil metagenome]